MARARKPITLYVAARHGSSGRGQLIHRVRAAGDVTTACGRSLERWSVVWIKEPIEILLCRSRACAIDAAAKAARSSQRVEQPSVVVPFKRTRRVS